MASAIRDMKNLSVSQFLFISGNSLPHGRSKYKKQRALVLSAVKLSSGQTLPRRVDTSKLRDKRYHPLNEIRYCENYMSVEIFNNIEETLMTHRGYLSSYNYSASVTSLKPSV